MAGDILINYGAETEMTVTGLHSLAASQTHVIGWSSESVDNGTNEYEDYLIGATFTSASTARAPGTIYIYAYNNEGDAAFSAGVPDLFSTGTEGTEGNAHDVHDAYTRDAGMRLLYAIATDDTASRVYVMPATSLAQAYGGWVPDQWALWITHDISTTTAAGFAASGNKVWYVPVHHRYT